MKNFTFTNNPSRFTNFVLRLSAFCVMFLAYSSTSAETPTAPAGTNTQSWVGNTFSKFTNLQIMQRVPEELEDIKLGNGAVFFAGYHERGGGGASFDVTNGNFSGQYSGFGSGFGEPVKSVAADANNVYYGTPGQGVKKYAYGGGSTPLAGYLSGKDIEGLCIKNGKMYISNYTDSKVHIYNVSTMTEDISWAVTNPTRITVDNNGKIWVLQWDPTSPQVPVDGPTWYGKNILSFSNTGVAGAIISDFEKPKSVAIDNNNQLLVGGLNEHSQIWKYGNLAGTPNKVGTFGELNGIFSGVAGQYNNTAKLHWISGIDVDATGNVYVACRYGSFWGAAVEKFNSAGVLQWRIFCASSLDCGGIDPANETEVYTKYHHYSLDYSKTTPGSEWSLKGFTMNRFKYPTDWRVDVSNDVGERSLGMGAVRIQGKLFAMRSYQAQYDLELYRFDPANDGEVGIPSVVMEGGGSGNVRTYNSTTSTWNVYSGDKSYKQYWSVCNNGDLYSLANITTSYSHIMKYPVQGLDALGNPIYNTSTVKAIPGNTTYRASGIAFDETIDCAYIIASSLYDADGENKFIRCIQNFNTTPTEKWTIGVPFNDTQYTPETNYGGGRVLAIRVAGDYVFLAYGYGHIRILNKLTGALVGTLTQNMNGWIGTEGQVDAKTGLNVTKRSNGEYVIFLENATMGNIQMHRWNPGAIVAIPVTSVSVSPTSSTINSGNKQQLTATVLPSTATNNSVSWSSNDTGIATVDFTGLVTGVAAGSVTITATTSDAGFTSSSVIKINASSWTTVDDGASGWTWTGFTNDPCTSCYNGTSHSTGGIEDNAQYTFTGTDLELYAETWSGAGTVQILIDGVSKGNFTQDIVPYDGAKIFATISGLSNTSHIINIVNVSGWSGIDYIRFYSSSGGVNYIESVGIFSSIQLYPNPASDFVTIGLNNSLDIEQANVAITDLLGKRIYNAELVGGSKFEINTSAFIKGIYIISITKGTERINKKLIIK